MSEVAEILTKAVEILDKKGWCQDQLINSAGNVCAFGAINTVVVGTALNMYDLKAGQVDAVAEALYRHLPPDFEHLLQSPRGVVVDYNNSARTTVEDIKDLFKRTIYDEEHK